MVIPTPTHFCPTFSCKLSPHICQQRKAAKQKLKNPFMTEYGAYFKSCKDCSGPVKLEEMSK